MFINQYIRYSSSASSFAMAVRLYFVLLLVVVSSMAQTFQYSRGWTNGRKRSDPSSIQQQQWIQRNGHPSSVVVPAEFKSNSFEDWGRYRVNSEKVTEDGGDSWLVHVNHCAKLATSLGSVLKNKEAKSDDPLIDVIH